MRISISILAAFLATAVCHAAVAESGVPIGSQPDPGPQANASAKDPVPEKKSSRDTSGSERKKNSVRTNQDTFDEAIVELPQGTLPITAGDTDSKTEKLVYDIFVKGLPAGKATFELRRREKYSDAIPFPVFDVVLKTHANRVTSTFYDVQDRASSIFDAKTGFSRKFNMNRKEGKARFEEHIAFNYEKDSMNADYERLRPDAPKDARFEAPNIKKSNIKLTGKPLDPLSAIYFMRSTAVNLKNVTLGNAKPFITLPVCSDRHVWNTKLYAVSIDHPDIGPLKNRECIVMEVDAPFRGLFEHVSKVRVWFDVETGVAVKMSTEIPIGPAEATLNVGESSNSPLNK